jgi:hypothetical protein
MVEKCSILKLMETWVVTRGFDACVVQKNTHALCWDLHIVEENSGHSEEILLASRTRRRVLM